MKKTLLLATLALSINAFAQQWNVKTPIPTARAGAGSAVVNNIIYVMGGSDGSGNNVGTVEAYNPATDTWSTKTPMPTPRGELGVAAVNGKIYAIGGYNGSAINTVEEYDPIANTWATKTSMPTSRSTVSVGVINDTIYVVGGWPGGMNILEAYNTVTDTWTTKASIAVGKMQMNGCAVLNSKLYYIGGKDASSTTFYQTNEAYNPTTNTWTSYANLPLVRWNGTATVLNNEIHYLGGADAAYTPNYTNHYVYNSSTDSWSNALSMLHKRSAGIAATVNGKIYVIGGIDSTNTLTNWNEEYNPGICYVYITVTDTLIINANLTGITPVTYANTIKIFPNPTNDHITIDYGSNYTSLSGYTLKIMNALSQTVFTTAINQQTSYINLSTWTGNGIYFVNLINPQGATVDIRKIVLQ